MSLRGGSRRCIDSGASCWGKENRRGPRRAKCGNCGKIVDLTFDESGPPRYIEHRMSGRPIKPIDKRTPRQIARQFLEEAVRQEIVTKFVIRNEAGGGTVHWKAGGKSFLASVLDVINVLEAHGFKVPAS